MAEGLWSFSTGRRGKSRVRVYERYQGSPLQMEWSDAGRRVQASLVNIVGRQVVDRDEAMGIARAYSERLHGSSGGVTSSAKLKSARRKSVRRPATTALPVEQRAALPVRDLFAHTLPAEPLCGIYFLLGPRYEVRYVGQSRDIMTRLAKHRKVPPAPFARVAWQPFALHELDAAEAEFIQRFDPPGNRSFPRCCTQALHAACDSLSPGAREILRGGR